MVLSNKISKKKLILILVVIEICTLFLVSKSLSNESYALDDVNILNQKFKDGNMFAFYVDSGDGDYVELTSTSPFPYGENYYLNENLTGCIDGNGELVIADIEYEDGTVTVKTNNEIYCFLYFDFKENLMIDVLKKSSLITEYRGPGYYHDETDRDTNQPYYTTPIYYWNGSINDNIIPISNKWNVLFAGSCWLMYRTTENNGVKLLYNGEPNIVEDSETGNVSYNCSSSRTNNNSGYYAWNSYKPIETSLDGNYYYGSSYKWDRSTKLYTLDEVMSEPVTLNSSNYQDLIGKFTCMSTTADGVCSTLYYIDSFVSGNTANTLQLANVTNYEDIISYNIGANPGFGYMHGDVNYYSIQYNGSSSNGSFPISINSSNVLNIGSFTPNDSTCFYDSITVSELSNGQKWFAYNNAQRAVDLINNSLNHDNSVFLGMYSYTLNGNCISGSNSFSGSYIIGAYGDELYSVHPTWNEGAIYDFVLNPPTLYNITSSSDQIKVQYRAASGINVPVVSNIYGYKLVSFKVNGTIVNGTSFTMPSNDVTITEPKFAQMTIVEIETATHDPFPSATGTTHYYENTFPGAISIEVKLTYQTYSKDMYYNYVRLFQTNSSTVYGTYANGTKTTTKLTIPGNYIKIDWYNRYSSSSYINKYGFKAEISPVYSNVEGITISNIGDGSGELPRISVSKLFYVGDSLTDNNDGTYTINNPIQVDWIQDYDKYNNYYICTEFGGSSSSYHPDGMVTSSCKYNTTHLIKGGTSLTMNYYTAPEVNEIKLSTSVSRNADGTYNLINPLTVKTLATQNNLANNYSYYSGYYICSNPQIDTNCSNIRYIDSTSNDSDYSLYYSYNPIWVTSNSYTYNNGVYTLDLTDSNAIVAPGVNFNDVNSVNRIGKAHYTCLNASGICSTLNYIYYKTNSFFITIPLTNGQYVCTDESNEALYKNSNNVVYKLLNYNTISSNTKIALDNWYRMKIAKYDDFVDKEEVFCDNKIVSDYGSWSLNSNNITTPLYFNVTLDSDLSCPVKTFAYSVDETTIGNGDLTYPIALASRQELLIIGSGGLISLADSNSVEYYDTINSLSELENGTYHYSINPNGVPYKGGDGDSGLRPALALKNGVEYLKGDGSPTNPYVVEFGNRITFDDLNYSTSKTYAVAGERVKLYLRTKSNFEYEVSSFKLNGTSMLGNSFIMPNQKVLITDITYSKVAFEVTSTNSDIIVPTSKVKNGVNVTLKTYSTHEILSFKLNGNTIMGDSFAMPNEDAIITDVELSTYYYTETETHHPFPSTTGTTTYFEKTFDGATSITVDLTYQCYGNTSYSYVRLYKTDSSTVFGTYTNSTKTTTTLTVPGNYLKIIWYNRYSSPSYLNYYGFRAIITPNYE